MTFTIGRAQASDLDALSKLFAGYRQFYRQAPDPVREKTFLDERILKGDSVIFLATEHSSGIAAGFTQLYPPFSSVRMRPVWLLNDLYVESAYRGNGVGSLLMQEAEEFARASGAAGIELATEVVNETAQRLYESRGWTRDTENFHYALNF